VPNLTLHLINYTKSSEVLHEQQTGYILQTRSGLPWLNLLARSFDAALLSGTPYAVGLTLAAFVYAGDVSGSHINPAVTIGLLINRSIQFSTAVFYIIAQIGGAMIARLVGGLVGNLAPDYQAAGGFAVLDFDAHRCSSVREECTKGG